MIQEYLFIGTENLSDESDLCIEGIVPEIEEIENSDCRIVKYTVGGGDEDSAKLLSAINEIVVDKYKPTVLTNESSAYFNKRLYPLFNEFERMLRKLIYLKSALYNKKEETKAIAHLETMTFNEIFEILFTDKNFMLKLKEKVNDKFYKFSSTSIAKLINELPENTLWSKLFEKGAVNNLEYNFDTIKTYRNEVMHAHNISYKNYKDAFKLIKATNAELDSEICKTIGLKESKAQTDKMLNYNKIINETIASNRISEVIRMVQEALRVSRNSALKIIESSPSLVENLEMQKKLNEISVTPEIVALQELLNSPTMIEIHENQNKIRENLVTLLGMLGNAMPETNLALEDDVITPNQIQDSPQELKSHENTNDDKDKNNKPSSD